LMTSSAPSAELRCCYDAMDRTSAVADAGTAGVMPLTKAGTSATDTQAATTSSVGS